MTIYSNVKMTRLNTVARDKKEYSNLAFNMGATFLNYTLDIKTVVEGLEVTGNNG
jgi:hypothetical protein